MNAKSLLAIAAVAAAFTSGVRADEFYGSDRALQIEGQRTRAEVQAEAAQVSRTRSIEPAGSRVAAPVRSTVDVQALRAETIRAARLGQLPHGEVGGI